MLLAVATLGGLALAAGGAGLAQTALGGKHDNKAPIEIKADSLEVEQDKQLATFRGNVDATQAEIRLRADTLVVHYRPKDQVPNASGKAQPAKAAKPAPAADGTANASSDPFTSGAISHIDAIGHVVVTSPEETAVGDTGFYDVDKQLIELEGSNVILTRCQDVLKGKKAIMHLDTGQSFLDTAPGQRVYGLFIPEQKGAQVPSSGPQPACPEPPQAAPAKPSKPLKKTPVAGAGK
jgi:lipopolysaccharide export system protein LptA